MGQMIFLSCNQPVQKFSSGTGSPGWSRKKGRKTVVVVEIWWTKGITYIHHITTKMLKCAW